MTQPPGPSSGYGTGRLAVPRHVVMLGRALQQCRPRLLPFDNMGGAEVLNVSARNWRAGAVRRLGSGRPWLPSRGVGCCCPLLPAVGGVRLGRVGPRRFSTELSASCTNGSGLQESQSRTASGMPCRRWRGVRTFPHKLFTGTGRGV